MNIYLNYQNRAPIFDRKAEKETPIGTQPTTGSGKGSSRWDHFLFKIKQMVPLSGRNRYHNAQIRPRKAKYPSNSGKIDGSIGKKPAEGIIWSDRASICSAEKTKSVVKIEFMINLKFIFVWVKMNCRFKSRQQLGFWANLGQIGGIFGPYAAISGGNGEFICKTTNKLGIC